MRQPWSELPRDNHAPSSHRCSRLQPGPKVLACGRLATGRLSLHGFSQRAKDSLAQGRRSPWHRRWPLAAGASLAERFGGILMAEVSRMRRRSAEAAARTVRVARALWPDHNPLRRSLDRVEAAIVARLVVALLAGAPMGAVAAGHLAYKAASRPPARSGPGTRPAPCCWPAPPCRASLEQRRAPGGSALRESGVLAWCLCWRMPRLVARSWCGLMVPAS